MYLFLHAPNLFRVPVLRRRAAPGLCKTGANRHQQIRKKTTQSGGSGICGIVSGGEIAEKSSMPITFPYTLHFS